MKISKEAYCKMRQNAESDESFKKRFTTERSRPYDVRPCLRKYWKKNPLAFNMVSLVSQFASHSGSHSRFYHCRFYRWLLYCHFSPFSGQITRNELHIVIGYKQSEFFRLVFDFAVNNENEAVKDLHWKGKRFCRRESVFLFLI